MSWWEDTEARARRLRGGAPLSQALLQRLTPAGVDPRFAVLPARLLAQVVLLGQELVGLVDELLLAADGDREGLNRALTLLDSWAEQAVWTVRRLEGPLVALIDALALDDDTPTLRPEQGAERIVYGSYSESYRFLYERVQMKLQAAGVGEELAGSFTLNMSDIYDDMLKCQHWLHGLTAGPVSFRRLAEGLLEIHAALHFHLLPNHLDTPGSDPTQPVLIGLPTEIRRIRGILTASPSQR